MKKTKKPVTAYSVSKREALPGELRSPILFPQKMKPKPGHVYTYYDEHQNLCEPGTLPTYVVHPNNCDPPSEFAYAAGAKPMPSPETEQQPTSPAPDVQENPVGNRNFCSEEIEVVTVQNEFGTTSSLPRSLLYHPFYPNQQSSPAKATQKPRGNTAYEITRILMQYVNIKILGEAIYSHTGTHYSHITGENLRRLIFHYCRPEVEKEGTSRLIEEIYKLLLCEPEICKIKEDLDDTLVSFMNGILDLKTHVLLPHSPRFNTYYLISAKWSGPSAHPVFDQTLAQITGGDPNLYQRILEVIGYCLVPDTNGKVFFVFQGVPDSGKSLLASFIRDCLDTENTVALDILSLGERFSASSLVGKQLCLSMDIPSSPLNAKTVSTFKTLTGGDPLTADVKYRPPITFFNRAKFILGTNHPLLTQNADPAFFRRAVVVPFLFSVPRHSQDFSLREKLNRERDAIIRDAIDAYWNLKENKYQFSGKYPINSGFNVPAEDKKLSIESALIHFVRENCIIGEECCSFTEDLFVCFEQQFSGFLNLSTFSRALTAICEKLDIKVEKLTKARKEPTGNPQARLRGICLRIPDQRNV